MVSDTNSNQRPVIQANEILAKIKRGEDVEYDGVIVEGDLDIRELALRTEHVDRESDSVRSEGLGVSDELMVVISEMTITNSEIKGKVNFSNARFQEPITFNRAEFGGDVYFKGAKFVGNASFTGARFTGSVYFGEAEFSSDASFIGAKFGGYAKFWIAKFRGYANFWVAKFGKDADFAYAVFSDGGANFTDAEFVGGDANFMGARFGGNTNFVKAEFTGGDANFAYAVFSGGDSNFMWTEFNGENAYFNGAEFGENAFFMGAKFTGNTSFRQAKFRGDATFGAANVGGAAKFGGDADFGGAKFSGEADFWGAKFGAYANLMKAEFDFELKLGNFKCERLYIMWDSIKDKLDYSGPAYLALIKNFKALEQFDDADNCYYQYRRESQARKKWYDKKRFNCSKLLDWIGFVSCGYGVKVWRPIVCAFVSVLSFSLLYKLLPQSLGGIVESGPSTVTIEALNNSILLLTFSSGDGAVSLSWGECLFLSFIALTGGIPDGLHPVGLCKYVVLIEGVIGYLFLALFVVVLARKIIR